ncbi:uncharacterized protein [Panulirus ornatus]|uniref:uncharacterized protein n=1 Tax=Panulirus ornatus TaxID=150431 RepID=UPI003A8979A1
MSLISVDNTAQSLTSVKVSILPHIPSDINVDLSYWRKQLEIAKVNAQAQLQVQRKKTEQARLAFERERLRLNASPSGPVSSQLGNLHVPKFSKLDVGRRSNGYDDRGRTNGNVIPPESATLPVTHRSQGKYSNRVKSCFNCGKAGHQVRDCWARAKESRDFTKSRSVSLFSALGPLNKVGKAVPALRKVRGCESVNQVVKNPFCGNYNAFLSEGCVRRCGVRRKETVSRDSGALQSPMLDGLVPREEFGDRVLPDGLSGPKEAPLVDVRVGTDLFTDHALVGTVDKLPVLDVDVVLGSDLAGGKMNPVPVLPTGPVESTEAGQLEEEVPEIVYNHDGARLMTAGTAGRVPEDIAVKTEEVKTSERKLCDTLSPGVASVETVDLKTLPPSEASEEKPRDTLSPGVDSVKSEEVKSLPTSESSERELCETLSPGVDSVETEDLSRAHSREKILPEDKISEKCDTFCAGSESVQESVDETEYLSRTHSREKTLHEDEIGEEKLCDTSHADFESERDSVSETVDLSHAHLREKTLHEDGISEEKLCDASCASFESERDSVGETVDLSRAHSREKTLHEDGISEEKLCDSSCASFESERDSVGETVDLSHAHLREKTLHEDGISEEKLCDSSCASFESERDSVGETVDLSRSHSREKTLHEDEIGEDKLCDASCASFESVRDSVSETEYLSRTHSREKTLHEDEIREEMCDTSRADSESVQESVDETEYLSRTHSREKTLHEDEIREEMCDTSRADSESVQESVDETEDLSRTHSRETPERRTIWPDKRSRWRRFEAGDEVLLLLQQPGQPLVARFQGPYTIIWSVGDSNYLVSTPDRRRSQSLCHINMPERCFSRDPPPLEPTVPVCIILRPAVAVCEEADDLATSVSETWDPGGGVRELNSDMVGYCRMSL